MAVHAKHPCKWILNQCDSSEYNLKSASKIRTNYRIKNHFDNLYSHVQLFISFFLFFLFHFLFLILNYNVYD